MFLVALFAEMPMLLLTGASFPVFAFWMLMFSGAKKPCGTLHDTLFFKNRLYRQVFAWHRYAFLQAISLTLLFAFFISVFLLIDTWSRYSSPVDVCIWLPLTFVFLYPLFLAFGGQGLSLALDRRLGMSWDRDGSLALHLTQRTFTRLSPGYLSLLVSGLVDHRRKLQSLGIDAPLTLESWLLTPALPRHLPEVQKFRGLITLHPLQPPAPLSSLGFFKTLKQEAVARRRESRPRHSHRGRVEIFGWLRFRIGVVKTGRVLKDFLRLLWRSPQIHKALHSLPQPAFPPLHALPNGCPGTRLSKDAALLLQQHAPGWTVTALPLKRINMLSLMLLVATHPRITIALTGWVGGLRVD